MEELIVIMRDMLEELKTLNYKIDEMRESNRYTFDDACEKLENIWGKLDSFEDSFIKYQ